MKLENRLKRMVCDQMCVGDSRVAPDSRFIEDLGVDSIDAIELASAIENEFGIEVPDEEFDGIRTFADAVAFVRARAGVASADP